MAFWDRISQVPWQSFAALVNTARDIRVHVDQKLQERTSWLTQQHTEHQQLRTARAQAQQQMAAYKNFNLFRGMDPEERSRQVDQISAQMPGWFQVQHARPWVRVATAPFRVCWHALRGSGQAALALHRTAGSNNTLIFLAMLYHILIFLTDPTLLARLYLNIAMIILVFIFVFDPSERNGDTYRTLFVLIGIFELLVPYLANNVAVIQDIDFVRLYIANSLILWTWIYYAVFGRGRDITSGLTRWWRIFIVIFWLGVAIFSLGTSVADFSDVELDTAGTEQWFAAKQIYSKSKEGWSMLINGVVGSFENIQGIFSSRLKQALGAEYYYGVVEENEKEPLGVSLENIKASQLSFEEDEPIAVFTTLKARTLDDTIKVNVSCFAGKEEAKKPGEIYPDDLFEIFNLQEEELDCRFERLPVGTNTITFTADFNFETIGYLKRYFADRDAIAAATRQNIDLLDQYQVLDQNPIAHYTNGPVMVAMGPDQALIGVSETYTVKPRLALTIDSYWEGMIQRLNEVVLIMPAELSLDTPTCTDSDWTSYTVAHCVASETEYESSVYRQCQGDAECIEDVCTEQLENYHAYTLSVANKSEYKDIEDFITISCRLNVDDVAGLLGDTPIATHYFYVKTRYDYQISDDTGVTVKEVEEPVAIAGEQKTKTTKVPMFSISNADRAMQYIFYNYYLQLADAETKFGTPVCLQAGIIAQTSRADPDYYENGRKGLMGVTDALATAVEAHADVGTSYNPYDAATSIALGNSYLQKLNGTTNDNFGNETVKAYYSMLYIQNEKETDQISAADLPRFATLVQSYVDTCEKLGLKNTPIQEEANEDSALQEKSVSYSNTTSTLVNFGLSGKAVTLDISDGATSVALNYAGIGFDMITGYFGKNSSQWESFDDDKLIQLFFDADKKELRYRFFEDFVKNIDLQEDKVTELLDGILYVEYTGSDLGGGAVEISIANDPTDSSKRTEICSVEWYEYLAYATCEEDDLPGLVLRNINTDEKTFVEGFANIQIDWSNVWQLEAMSS